MIYRCYFCNAEFIPKIYKNKTIYKFCSHICWLKYRYKNSTKSELICEICGTKFTVLNYRKDAARFCSLSCRSKGCYDKAKEGGFGARKGCLPWNKGIKATRETRDKLSRAHMGQKAWNKGKGWRANDKMWRLNKNISSAIGRTLKGVQKGGHWEGVVGYTLKQLKKHLEEQFVEGMTWDNYGRGWWLDHKIPVRAFNFKSTKNTDFKRCWALDNLQPMWKKENMCKNGKLERPFQPTLF